MTICDKYKIKDKVDAVFKYSELISILSVPIDKINDYKWVKENIVELNPFNEVASDIEEIINIILGIKVFS